MGGGPLVGKEVRGSVNGSRGSLDNIGTWKTNIVLFDFFDIVSIAFPEFQEEFCFPSARGVQIVFCKCKVDSHKFAELILIADSCADFEASGNSCGLRVDRQGGEQ